MMRSLPSTQTAHAAPREATSREDARAVSHPWMGRALSLWPDEELALILDALEQHLFGERRSEGRHGRSTMIARIYDLDMLAEADRPRASRPGARS